LKNLLLLFSHKMTAIQEEQAVKMLGVSQYKYLPKDLQKMWSDVPPDAPNLSGYLEPIKKWIADEAEPGDYILVQGDYGATYIMVNYAFLKGFVPIYATTERSVEEKESMDGEIQLQRRFSHVRYRLYERC
jgi:hypothetical protein